VILLDTHVLVWLQREPRKLSKAAASAIRRSGPGGGIAISVATLVELAGLISRGKIRSSGSVDSALRQYIQGVEVVPLGIEAASLTAYFPPDFSSDPMDRIIAATARAENMPLVTADERILNCPLIKTIW